MTQPRLDAASRLVLQVFLRKLTFLLLIAAGLTLAAPQRLSLALTLLQAQAMLGGAMSIAIGLTRHERIGAPSLTSWDEAIAFSGVGLLAHFGAQLLA